jgi:glutathione synthase
VEGFERHNRYYRAGYGPDDYPTEAEWSARTMLEHARCPKCPSISDHLSGAKKIQQALALPGVVER